MKSGITGAVLVLSVLTWARTPALADLTATVTLSDSYGDAGGADHGGEFLAAYSGFDFTPVSLGETADRFEVFCVERNEFINFGTTYYVDFNTAAVDGGVGGGSPDPLSSETAFLYSTFVTGGLAPYDYADSTPAGRVASANALQNVIWYFEDELGADPYTLGLDAAESDLADQFYQLALNSTWTGIGTVQIMNLYKYADGTGNKQDQLVMSPVPAPGAVFLAALGFGLFGLVNRRPKAEA